MSLHDRLTELAALENGWLDGNGQPPSAAARDLAQRLGQVLSGTTTSPMRVYPTLDGGIELAWQQDDRKHTAVIGPYGRLHLTTHDPADPAAAAYEQSAAALRREASALERLCSTVGWTLTGTDLTPDQLRAAARHLDTLEPE